MIENKLTETLAKCLECGKVQHALFVRMDGERLVCRCKHCGSEFKTLTEAERRQRKRDIDKAYRMAHKDRINDAMRKWRADNIEAISARDREYYARNKDKINERHRSWYAANIEKERKRSKDYYEEHKYELKCMRVWKKLYTEGPEQ